MRARARRWQVLLAIVLVSAIAVGGSVLWGSHWGRSTIAEVKGKGRDDFCAPGQQVLIEGTSWYAAPSSFPGNGTFVGDLIEEDAGSKWNRTAHFIWADTTVELSSNRACV